MYFVNRKIKKLFEKLVFEVNDSTLRQQMCTSLHEINTEFIWHDITTNEDLQNGNVVLEGYNANDNQKVTFNIGPNMTLTEEHTNE